MTDSAILDLYWARDEQAIFQTEKTYGKQLNRLAFGIVASREDAQECVSDTYLKAWHSIPPQRPVHFYAYLAKTCRNLAFGILDYRAAAKRKAEMIALTEELALCIPDPANERDRTHRELSEVLNRFLGTLPKESRVIFLRRYWFGDSVDTIARRYGFGQSKVKTQLHRTRERLRKFLEKEGIAV